MAEPALIVRDFHEFAGLDYRSNNITRPERFAREAVNAISDESGNITLRKGVKPIAFLPPAYRWSLGAPAYEPNPPASGAWYFYWLPGGLYSFRRRTYNASFGSYSYSKVLLLAGVDSLYELTKYTVTIGYVGGVGLTGSFSMLPTNNGAGSYTYRAVLKSNGVQVANIDLGNLLGASPVSAYKLSTLVAAIDALAAFTCTFSGTTGQDAFMAGAHLPITALTTIANGGSLVLPVYFFEPCNVNRLGFISEKILEDGSGFGYNLNPDQVPSQGFVSAVDARSVMLFANPIDGGLVKYDGNGFYCAGLPRADTGGSFFTATALAGGTLNGTYYYAYSYEMEDSNGNTIEGDLCDDVQVILDGGATAGQTTVVIPRIDACRAGGSNATREWFMENYAVANNGGTETSTTVALGERLTVTGNSLHVGQNCFFRDNAGTLHTRRITASTATTITISGAAVTVANGCVFSAGLKINLYRNKAGGTKKYLVRTFAEATVGITYVDAIADASLGFEYTPPYEDLGHGLFGPVDVTEQAPAYLCSYKGLVVSVSASGRVQFCDPDGPEYYVSGGSTIQLLTSSTDVVTGIGANQEAIFVFKPNEIVIIRGDLTTGRWSQEKIDGVGCDSHHTIAVIDGWIWFWSRAHGVNRIRSVDWPESCSYRIDNVIQGVDLYDYNDGAGGAGGQAPRFANAAYFPHTKRYALYVPSLDLIDGVSPPYSNAIPNDDSLFLVCDTSDAQFSDPVTDPDGSTTEVIPKLRWWKFSGINALGRQVLHDGKWMMWHADVFDDSISDGVTYHLVEEGNTGTPYDYTDFAGPISFSYEHGWIYLKEPSTIKKWLRSELYSFRADLANQTDFTITAELEIRYKDGEAWSSQTITFDYDPATSVDEFEKIFEFKPVVAKAIKLKLSGTFWCQAPLISGWTTEVEQMASPHIGRG